MAGAPLGNQVSSVIREGLGAELLLLCVERSYLRQFKHLVKMPPDRLSRDMFQARPAGRRPGRALVQVERLYLHTGLGKPLDPPVRDG